MNITLIKKIGVIFVIGLVYILVCKKVYYHLENKSELFYENIKLEKKTKVYDIIHHNLPSLRSLTLLSDILPYILLTIIFFQSTINIVLTFLFNILCLSQCKSKMITILFVSPL